jgi:Rrf2 family cysteine metabolism transcriptional repressor
MKLNTKVRYGTRAMLELALHYDQGPLSLSEIAASQQLSDKYLETMLGALRAAGLVSSVRGAQGGYMLALPPDQITLQRIYDVFEGGEPYVPCTNDPTSCQRQDACVTAEVWERMYHAAMGVLAGTTLADLVTRQAERYREMADGYTYEI